MLCDGQEYDRILHKPLFDVIGTRWGVILSTHFRVPDLRDEFLIGAGKDGRVIGTKQEFSTALPKNPFIVTRTGSSHSHDILTDITPSNNFGHPMQAVQKGLNPQQGLSLPNGGGHDHGFEGGDAETRPKNIAVNYIIKAK